ncbi:MAG: hypothetical protein JWO88_1502 [Frankiales bacterium]|nr:hypothetical protein [Frankiales bacterium]
MKRTIIGAAVLALGLAGLGTSYAGTDDGQGAQKRALVPTAGDMTSQCKSGAEAEGGPNGFAILNLPGKSGDPATDRIVGEVSLKNATPNSSFIVNLAMGSNCVPLGTLTTNGQGNGNFHIDNMPNAAGTYFVVLQDMVGGAEAWATSPVSLR